MNLLKRFKRWLIDRVLAVWAREELLAEIAKLEKNNEILKHQLELRDEYIAGLESGIRALRRIVINTGGEKK